MIGASALLLGGIAIGSKRAAVFAHLESDSTSSLDPSVISTIDSALTLFPQAKQFSSQLVKVIDQARGIQVRIRGIYQVRLQASIQLGSDSSPSPKLHLVQVRGDRLVSLFKCKLVTGQQLYSYSTVVDLEIEDKLFLMCESLPDNDDGLLVLNSWQLFVQLLHSIL